MAIIRQRIDGLQNAMKDSQDAANSETKSSSGDKFETSRAMNQLEKDMYARQLTENNRELSGIMETNCDQVSTIIEAGSFVQCDGASFFILAGLGKVDYEGQSIFIISPNAPLAGLMYGKSKGESFLFNKKEMVIDAVF